MPKKEKQGIVVSNKMDKTVVVKVASYDPIIVTTLDEAVNEAYSMAKDGDIILLSPTTSSFDQYTSYEQRGRHFKELVNKL